MLITGHTVEKLEDPTGILTGERYEYILKIEVPEEDELFSENGLYLKSIFVLDENGSRIAQYQFFEEKTDRYIDLSLEEDEEALIIDYCKQHIKN
ncbi:DUF6509 family protein [Metabacillus arenae]|uniref:Pullulanase n=1 Tax=Metabacillus arenae TaxID=2771434 RepID=A0A926NLJ5_9BACI|nr:DUF6509 family protein [Metabacillus arenae]MBD1382920.1 pullulanase [Metabacillus arenae]